MQGKQPEYLKQLNCEVKNSNDKSWWLILSTGQKHNGEKLLDICVRAFEIELLN